MFVSALSRHPDPAVATGEAVGKVLDHGQGEPDVLVLFLSTVTVATHREIIDAVALLVRPGLLVVVTTPGVVAGSEEIEDRSPATGGFIAVWAGWTTPVRWFPLQLLPGHPPVVAGLPASIEPGSTLICLGHGDERSLDAIGAIVDSQYPGVTAVGGLGQARAAAVSSDDPDRGAASGFGCLLLGPEAGVVSVVCSTHRPLGPRWLVTEARGKLIVSLDGKSPRQCMADVLSGLDANERLLATSGFALEVSAAGDALGSSEGSGSGHLIDLLGLDKLSDAMAVSGPVATGCFVQLHIRDPEAERREMASRLSEIASLVGPTAALIFADQRTGADSCGLTGATAALVQDHTDSQATAGLFVDAQLGFVNGRTIRFRSCATVVLFPCVP